MIDRKALVERHDVEIDSVVAQAPLSVGNGELCFTVDVTGLQSLPGCYPLPERNGGAGGSLLGTKSQWGWHCLPFPGGGPPLHDPTWYETRRGPVPYADLDGPLDVSPQAALRSGASWLRANPHRLDLAQIGFRRLREPGRAATRRPIEICELSGVRQRLLLWSGLIESRFALGGEGVEVATVCHPEKDAIGLRVRSGALATGLLGIEIAFAYGSSSWNVASDWEHPEAHRSAVFGSGGRWRVERQLDETRYRLEIRSRSALSLDVVAEHLLVLLVAGPELEVVFELTPSSADAKGRPRKGGAADSFEAVAAASASHWERFWRSGAAIDLSASEDDRAEELERRIVLSQYLTAINAAGSLPPQETGLMVNSWYGRFHLEMHWWHAAHFALWGRPELLERAMPWYLSCLPVARSIARRQGYAGARWPKQVGPDATESPSPIGPFLVWQQPHPIHLAELIRRCRPEGDALERYGKLVLETAEFLADFADPTAHGYALGPPLVPAQECYADDRRRTANPTFELAYWQWALGVAQAWRGRLGLEPDRRLDDVAGNLVHPTVLEGRYAAVAGPPYTLRRDHPSMLLGLGLVPATPLIDAKVMSATYDDVLADWDWDSAWGWDFPAMAMTATRLGRPDAAVEALLFAAEKNSYLANGHNRQSETLPVYLPGNGALLAAVALMAGGFDGAARSAPGFPEDGRWQVVAEGFCRAP